MANTKLTAEGSELLDDASNYSDERYENPSVTADVCVCRINDGAVEVLLIKRKFAPFKDAWAIPGGFLNTNREGILDCATRELAEETGVIGISPIQFGAYGDPMRDPRQHVVTIAHYAIVTAETMDYNSIEAMDDANEYAWFKLKELPDMAFDHSIILMDLFDKLKAGVEMQVTAFNFITSTFTWRDLLNVYRAFDCVCAENASNFRKFINARIKFEETGESRSDVGRPAILFKNPVSTI